MENKDNQTTIMTNNNLNSRVMKKIYLTKMYIKWNDKEVPTNEYRLNAKPITAFHIKKRALISLKLMIKAAQKEQNKRYKKYFFIEEIEVI